MCASMCECVIPVEGTHPPGVRFWRRHEDRVRRQWEESVCVHVYACVCAHLRRDYVCRGRVYECVSVWCMCGCVSVCVRGHEGGLGGVALRCVRGGCYVCVCVCVCVCVKNFLVDQDPKQFHKCLHSYPWATPSAPGHTQAKVTAHQEWVSPVYIYGCVHTEVHVRHHDHRWVLTPNVHWCTWYSRGVTPHELSVNSRHFRKFLNSNNSQIYINCRFQSHPHTSFIFAVGIFQISLSKDIFFCPKILMFW